jgi:hypothetical protein
VDGITVRSGSSEPVERRRDSPLARDKVGVPAEPRCLDLVVGPGFNRDACARFDCVGKRFLGVILAVESSGAPRSLVLGLGADLERL